MDQFTVLAVGESQLNLALSLGGQDFEDDLQIAAAISARADAIVTRDTTGFAASPIEVLLPGQLLVRLA
jgi:predicted nucleic acid-binding protein